MTNILVTGGSGFIGSNIVDELSKNDLEVTVFDKKKPNRGDIKFIKGDITSFKQLKKAMRDMEYVYHLAAFSNVNKVLENSLKVVDLNVMSTAKVLKAASDSQVVRVLYASSYFIGSKKGHLYTTTKKASELMCRDYNELYGLPFTILRYGTAYGPMSRGEDVVSIFVKRSLQNQPLFIQNSGRQSRRFIYVEDLAKGNVAALKSIAENQTYTLEGAQSIMVREVAEIVKKLTGDSKIGYNDKNLHVFKGRRVSSQKNIKELGWKPEVDFEEGVRRYIEWYRTKMGAK